MRIIFTLILLLGALVSIGQDSTYKPYKKPIDKDMDLTFWDKCYSGGDLSFYGGSGGLFFNISPLLGYRPGNKSFSYGIGATYQYTSFNYFGLNYNYSLFGIRAFIRQELGNMFLAHAEIENYFTKGENVLTRQVEVISIPCANVFIGYRHKFSDFSYSYIMLGLELIRDPSSYQYVYPLHPLLFKAGYILDIKGK
jgi:hypothetical protein